MELGVKQTWIRIQALSLPLWLCVLAEAICISLSTAGHRDKARPQEIMRVTYEMQSITQFSASQSTAKFALLFYLAPMAVCQIKRGFIHVLTK